MNPRLWLLSAVLLGSPACGGAAFDPATVYARKHGQCTEEERLRPPAPAASEARAPIPSNRLEMEIEAVVAAHRDEVRRCYVDAVDLWPGLGGGVDITFVIQPDGSVSEAWVARNDTGVDVFACCVARRVRSWHMPAHQEPWLRITWPFGFDPATAPEPTDVWGPTWPKPVSVPPPAF